MAAHSVDLAFAALILAAFSWFLRLTSDAYFQFDDWGLVGRSVRGMVEPYNDHLSVTILLIYRALVEAFGFSYTPFRVVGLTCLLAVPVTYYVTTRHLLGPPVAAIAGLSMLAYGNIELYPAVLNHYLVLIGGIGCAAALNKRRRADWVLAVALCLSLSAAGGGLAVAAACVVHNACMRAPLRRWLVVLLPCAAWGCWWVVLARGTGSRFHPERPTIAAALSYARQVAWTPFTHAGLGNPILAAALAGGFICYAGWRVREGRAAAANVAAWTTAIAVWAVGLAYGRGSWLTAPLEHAEPIWFRYQLVAFVFALLAVVPRHPIGWPTRFPQATRPGLLLASAAVIVTLSGAFAIAIRSDVESNAAWIAGYGRRTRGELLVVDLGPGVIRDRAALSLGFFNLRAGEVRGLLDRYGHPLSTSLATADRQLVDLGIAFSRPGVSPGSTCHPTAATITWPATSAGPLRLWSDQPSWTVDVRRFGSTWIPLTEAGANETVALSLPGLSADVPWQVRTSGACRV